MAHIQRRGSKGHYRYRVRYIDDTGKERSKTFDLKGDADRFLIGVSHQVLAGVYIDPSAGRITVKGYGEQWRKNLTHLRPTSEAVLEGQLRLHVYPFIGSRAISTIKPSDIATLLRDRLKPAGPLAPSTVRQLRTSLSTMFKAAVSDRVISSNPVASVRGPAVPKTEVEPLTIEQVRYLETHLPERYRAIISLVLGSGLRSGEVRGLTTDRVDWLRKTIRVDRQLLKVRGGEPVFGPPKTSASVRTVPVSQKTIDVLAAHVKKYPSDSGLIFTSRERKPVTSGTFGRAWRTPARAIGIDDDDGLHLIRHVYASVLIDGGCSVKEVQKRLGHESATVTLNTYAHLWPDNDDSTRRVLDEMFARPSQAVAAPARPSQAVAKRN